MPYLLETHPDDDWRITDDATDNWLGVISSPETGDDVVEAQALVVEVGFERAKAAMKAACDVLNGRDRISEARRFLENLDDYGSPLDAVEAALDVLD